MCQKVIYPYLNYRDVIDELWDCFGLYSVMIREGNTIKSNQDPFK